MIVALPGPVICKPPPFPGDIATTFSFNVTFVRFMVPELMLESSSIPPPARSALLPEIVTSVAVTVPPRTFKTPPPLPVAPSAILLVMVVPLINSRVPPLL